jgi:peptide/nickel transport system permease protein
VDRPPGEAVETVLPPGAVPPADAPHAPMDVRAERRARRRELLRALLGSKTFVVGTAIVVFWVLVAIFWRAIVPYGPEAVDAGASLQAPSSEHWFGTDNLGRDVFSRVLAGSATVLVVAPLATLLGLAGGITVGLVSGFYRGWVDDVTSRLVDALLSIPLIIMAVLVLASRGRDTRNVILVIGIIFTPLVARTVRSAVLAEREREYVAAARLRGERGPRIMFAEILPNITAPILVEATIRLGYAIFTAATLSFLGLGIQDPSPDWGLTIANGRAYLQIAWWMVIFPSAALATLVVGVNLAADGLRKVIEE